MAEALPPGGETLVVKCDCGFEVRGTSDEVVAGMRDHARTVHNMSATPEQINVPEPFQHL